MDLTPNLFRDMRYSKIWVLVATPLYPTKSIVHVETVLMDQTSTKLDALKHPDIWKHIVNSEISQIFNIKSNNADNCVVEHILGFLGNWIYVEYQKQCNIMVKNLYDIILVWEGCKSLDLQPSDEKIYFDSLIK